MLNQIKAKIVEGYGVASGKNSDPRFPQGTLALQIPFFRKEGLDLGVFHLGTLNLDISPHSYKLLKPKFKFNRVKWSEHLEAENFSFYPCLISLVNKDASYECLVYWPHPSTKPDFHQSEKILEIMGPLMSELSYGSEVLISAKPCHILFANT